MSVARPAPTADKRVGDDAFAKRGVDIFTSRRRRSRASSMHTTVVNRSSRACGVLEKETFPDSHDFPSGFGKRDLPSRNALIERVRRDKAGALPSTDCRFALICYLEGATGVVQARCRATRFSDRYACLVL